MKVSLRLIERSLMKCERMYVSWSGGKDSTVMLHLVRQVAPEIDVLYMRSGFALPDTTVLVERLTEEWKLRLHVLDAPVDYLELCETFGLPHMRSTLVQKQVVQVLKKDRATVWAVEMGFDGLFWGLRAEESKGRAALCRSCPRGKRDGHGVLRVSPVGAWTAEDVWAYTFAEQVPCSALYDRENCGFTRETLRNTGWLSTDGETRGQIEWLRRNYPEQFQKVRDLL